MAMPKLPSIEAVLEDPSILKDLPTPMILEIKEQLLQLDRSLGGATNVAANPIEMAISNPKYKWMDSRHLHFLGDKIADAVSRSKDDGEHTGLIVTEPPRHAKSHTCSVWTPFWYLAKYPEDNVLIISAEHNNAAKWGEKVRRLVEVHGADYNLKINPRKASRDDWELTTGGGMKSVGAGGQIAGNPAKLLIFDDVVKNDEEARSDYQRKSMWDWWDGTVQQRIEPDTTTIGIGTRYHEDDLIGRLLQHSTAGDGMKFDLVSLAAKALADDPLGRYPGEGLWLEHFPQSFYDGRELTVSPYVWSSVYQQTPTAPGGNMVDPDWWRFYRPSELPGAFDQEVQSWDISLDAQAKTDSYHAGFALSRKGALIFLRDGFREHCDINKVISTMRAWNQIYPRARAKLIERATAGVALAQTLRAEMPGVIAWPPKGKQKGSKEACLDAIIPAIRAGNVLLPLNPDGTKPKWVRELMEEMRVFPRGSYDDQVDAISQGVGYMLPGGRSDVIADHQTANQVRPQMTPVESHADQLRSLISKLGADRLDAMRKWQQRDERSAIPSNVGFDTGRPSGTGPRHSTNRRKILC